MLHYNVAISALAAARDHEQARDLFTELDARGEADVYSYGALSSALCRAGKLEEAVALVDSMSDRRIVPNLVIYCTLLHGAITAGALPLARSLQQVVVCAHAVLAPDDDSRGWGFGVGV